VRSFDAVTQSSLSLGSLALGVLASSSGCGGASASSPPSTAATTAPTVAPSPARRPFPGAEPARRIPSDIAFESLEGPFWDAARGVLLFSDVVDENGPAAKIYRYAPETRTFAIEPYPVTPTSTNGLAIDPQGHLVACERYNGALVRVTDGKRTVLADHFPLDGGAPLAAPNDLIVRADGTIYFSDTKWGAKPGAHAAQAVYRIAPNGDVSVAYAVSMPNGVALSPDGRTLYVGSDAQNIVWKLPVDASGVTGPASVLIDASQAPGGLFKVPDGIGVDDAGNLYVANNDDDVKAIEVFSPEGHYLGDIALPDKPSNCTFGGKDRKTLYITTLHAVYEVAVPTPGLP
jgi:gluconolactonase